MVTVKLECRGGSYEVTATGHATGSEAVCAAVSMLLFATAAYLEQPESGAMVSERKLGEGDARLCFSGGEKSQAAFGVLRQGFFLLAEEYADLVRISDA